jgi:COPI associated protein
MSEATFTTACDVLHEMSFSPTKDSRLIERIPSDGQMIPLAPMPSGAPPLPPGNHYESYQSTARSGNGPTIINYQISNVYEPKRSFLGFRGDSLIQPNTGQTNSADGDSFIESVWKMRVANLIACTLAIIFEIPNFLGHVFSLQPARAVLGIYLSFFAGLLCCFEFHNPRIDKIIQDQCGILNHPVGRSCLLLLMGGLAIGQTTILDILLGLVFVANAIVTIIAFIRYPEYRRQTEEQTDIFQVASSRARQYAWANPEKLQSLVGGEGEALMKALGETR